MVREGGRERAGADRDPRGGDPNASHAGASAATAPGAHGGGHEGVRGIPRAARHRAQRPELRERRLCRHRHPRRSAFQLSRLVDPMRRAASVGGSREGSKKSIVLGKGVGRPVECDRLEPGACGTEADGSSSRSSGTSTGARRWRARGDTCGDHRRRALNPTSTPRRAREAGGRALTATPSAKGAENAARAARVDGDWVQLTVNDGGVLLGRASAQERDEARYRGGVDGPKAPPSATLNPRLISDGVECVRLAEAVAERAGRKAATCGDLTRIAARPGSGFTALDGVVVPFGAMESRLRECGDGRRTKTDRRGGRATRRVPAGHRAACDGVRDVITTPGARSSSPRRYARVSSSLASSAPGSSPFERRPTSTIRRR